MKTIFSLIIVSVCISAAIGQSDLGISFNSTHSGRNISAFYAKEIKPNHAFGGGLRININKRAHNDDQFKIFMKRLYATEFINYLGVEGFYYYNILNSWKHLQPYLHCTMQMTYAGTRNRMFLPAAYSEEIGILYKEITDYTDPYLWIEPYLGIGFIADLTNGFYLKQSLGFGVTFILGKDKQQLVTYSGFNWEFAGLIQVGLGYRFGSADAD